MRVQQLQKVSQLVSQAGAKELQGFPVWLGGLLNPEAYITATRQCVAQANSCSLEELALEVTITYAGLKNDQKDSSFGVSGLKQQAAQCKNNELLLPSTIMMDLPVTILKWSKISSELRVSKLTLPVYLNSTRTELVFTVDLAVAAGHDSHSSSSMVPRLGRCTSRSPSLSMVAQSELRYDVATFTAHWLIVGKISELTVYMVWVMLEHGLKPLTNTLSIMLANCQKQSDMQSTLK